jgi:hypothetical protein
LALLFITRRNNTDKDSCEEDEGEADSEMSSWLEFSPMVLAATEFLECENMLAPEAQLDTWANQDMDEGGFLSMLTLDILGGNP